MSKNPFRQEVPGAQSPRASATSKKANIGSPTRAAARTPHLAARLVDPSELIICKVAPRQMSAKGGTQTLEFAKRLPPFVLGP
jgi:hypothetical protein